MMHGDCLELMQTIPDSTVDMVLTDPPYFRVKNEPWDRHWNTREGFLEWLDLVAEQWQRVLKPNGSIYCFASPQMAAHVEVMLGRRFNVLNRVTWVKRSSDNHNSGQWSKATKEGLRAFFPQTESIIFAEHYEADNIATGEAGYQAKCDELRGFVFEPLRAYLDSEKQRAGFTNSEANKALGTQMASHYFTQSQWALPTEQWYNRLRELFNSGGGEYLRKDYECLRKDYECLRRPFRVTADVPYTDVWTFKTVAAYPGKHPCEKPSDMLAHMITASTNPGAVVLDSFVGNGSTGVECKRLGREFIGIEQAAHHYEIAKERIEAARYGCIGNNCPSWAGGKCHDDK